MAEESDKSEVMEGYLKKRGYRTGRWKLRFARVETTQLLYGDSEDVIPNFDNAFL